MDEREQKSNVRYLPAPAANAEAVGASKEGVATVDGEVKPPSKPADVLELRKGRLKDEVPSAEIFARRLPELLALNDGELVRVNLPVQKVVMRVLGVLPKLKALRGQIEATFLVFDFKQFDGLEDYAFALHHAHNLVLSAVREPSCPPELRKDALELQRLLQADCRALIGRGLLESSTLRHLRDGQGYQVWSSNLAILAAVLNQAWPDIVGRCATMPANLTRAGVLANQLLAVAGQLEEQPENIAYARNVRERAFTLLTRAYHRARLAALYVLGSESAADAVIPALSSGRGKSRRASKAKSRLEEPSTNAANTEDSTKQ